MRALDSFKTKTPSGLLGREWEQQKLLCATAFLTLLRVGANLKPQKQEKE